MNVIFTTTMRMNKTTITAVIFINMRKGFKLDSFVSKFDLTQPEVGWYIYIWNVPHILKIWVTATHIFMSRENKIVLELPWYDGNICYMELFFCNYRVIMANIPHGITIMDTMTPFNTSMKTFFMNIETKVTENMFDSVCIFLTIEDP